MLSKKFLPICILCSTISLVFAAIVLVTSDNDVTQTLNWAVSDIYSFGSASVTFYVGIYVYTSDVTITDDVVTNTKFSSSDCEYSFCDDCASANKVVLAFAALFFVFCLPGLYAGVIRMGNGNSVVNKNIGILSASAATICGAISLIVFSSNCLKKIEDENTNVDWNYGAAYGLLSAAVVLKFVDCLFNSIIDTEAARQGLLEGQ